MGTFDFPKPERRRGYDVAQICANGHVTTRWAAAHPEYKTPFCSTCGQRTITACPSCRTEIRGGFHNPRPQAQRPIPKCCHACGEPYPWTQASRNALHELVLSAGLDDDDTQTLTRVVDDLNADGPRTELAIHQFGLLSKKLSAKTLELLTQAISVTATDKAFNALINFITE